MVLQQFLNCLAYFNVNTGTSLEGVFNAQSGDANTLYNILYPVASAYISGTVNSTITPLISVGQTSTPGNFSGQTLYHLGYQNTNNFELLMDVSYTGCTKNQTYGTDYVLLSTAQNTSGFPSGFIIGINDCNRLFFQTSGLQYSLGYELKARNFIFASLSNNQFVEFGVYDIGQNAVFSKTVDVGAPVLQTNDLYVGGFLNNNNPSYTGFFGDINQVFAFQNALSDYDRQACVNCSFATGSNISVVNNPVTVLQITGGSISGISGPAITGYANVTGQLLTSSGTNVNIIIASGVSGSVTSGQIFTPLFTETVINVSGQAVNFLYDNASMTKFSTSNLYFQIPFLSGDSVEIYTYPSYNPNNNLRLVNSIWPNQTGFIQLISNGVAETFDLDYALQKNRLSGFNPSTDVLSYDMISSQPTVVFFSGLYQDLINSGLYFQPIPTFNQQMAAYLPNAIYITGISGICTGNQNYPNFGFDIYLNGQKLVSGMQYQVSTSGVSGFVVAVSGNAMLELYTQLTYVPSSGYYIDTITDFSDSEMTFVPQYGGMEYTFIGMTGQTNYINNVSGFCESVWINGMRQVRNVDYLQQYPCMTVSGFFSQPNLTYPLFNNDIGLFNTTTAPYFTYANVTLITGSFWYNNLSWNLDLNGFPTGKYIELWVNENSAGWSLYQMIPTNQSTLNSIVTVPNVSLEIALRYHNNNIIGNFIYAGNGF